MKKNNRMQNQHQMMPAKKLSKGRIALAVLSGLLFVASIAGMVTSGILSTPENNFAMIVFPICGFVVMITFLSFFLSLMPVLQRKMMKVSAPYTKEYIESIGLYNMVGNQSEIECPYCGRKNKNGSNFCDGCGKPLTKSCPKCGTTIRIDAKFCSCCGERLY